MNRQKVTIIGSKVSYNGVEIKRRVWSSYPIFHTKPLNKTGCSAFIPWKHIIKLLFRNSRSQLYRAELDKKTAE